MLDKKTQPATLRHLAVFLTALLMLISSAQVITLGQAAPPRQAFDLCSALPAPSEDVKVYPGKSPDGLSLCQALHFGRNKPWNSLSVTQFPNATAARAYIDRLRTQASGVEGRPQWVPTTAYGDYGFDIPPYLVPRTDGQGHIVYTGDGLIFARNCYVVSGDVGLPESTRDPAKPPDQLRALARQADQKLMGAPCASGGAQSTATTTTIPGGQPVRATIKVIQNTAWFGADLAIIQRRDGSRVAASEGMQLQDGDRIISRNSRVTIVWQETGGVITIGPESETTMEIVQPGAEAPRFQMLRGIMSFFFPRGEEPKLNKFEAGTNTVVIAIKGTTFNLAYDDKTRVSTVQVEEGVVNVTPTDRALPPFQLPAGKQVQVSANNVGQVANYVPVPGSGGRLFPETGKVVSGIFLDYWFTHGGLAQQGYPISDVMREKSDLDGKEYTVQYFERAVFEHHPEFAPPNNVLLSQLGTFQYKRKYPNGAPNQRPNTSAGSRLFNETGKRVGGKFLDYWNKNGGLAQQGLPLSDEFQEVSETDGKTYLVQYFERAVFEYHPEYAPPNDVLLSLLGVFFHKQKYGGGRPPGTAVPPAATPTTRPGTAVPNVTVTAQPGTPAPTSAPSGQEVDITREGRVEASSTFTGFTPQMAVDGSRATSWFAPGGAPVTYRWTGTKDETISKVVVLSTAQHSDQTLRSTGFESAKMQVLNASGGVVIELTVSLAGRPDPDATFTLTNVMGRSVVLLFSGYDNPERGGFSELQVWAKR